MILSLNDFKLLNKERRTIKKLLKDPYMIYCLGDESKYDMIVKNFDGDLEYTIHMDTVYRKEFCNVYKKLMLRRYRILSKVLKKALKDIDKEI